MDLKNFLITYEMTIEKCLKSMAMDPDCNVGCSEIEFIDDFGGKGCKSKCKKNSLRALSETERHVILYSMLYVPNYNTHPDVREHLWMRASGASQYIDSYDEYR